MRWGPVAVSCGFAALFFTKVSFAQDESPPPREARDVSELSLQDLLNTPVAVASAKSENLRDAPGIVTVITREEILASGARDLFDVLMLVPGFSPATDVEGAVDMGFRGNWGHEGKILLMVDGEQMNELLFDDNVLGHHYPVDMIKSIEIIRGPGSALYGGWAELAVINIITLGASDLKGAQLSASYGRMTRGLGHEDLNLGIGQENVGGVDGLHFSATGSVGHAQRSDQTYSDFSGNSYSMNGNSNLDSFFVNLGLQYKGLHARLLYDRYATTAADAYTVVGCPYLAENCTGPGQAPSLNFTTLFLDAFYEWKMGALTVTPRFTYKQSIPWESPQPGPAVYEDVAERWTGRIIASYAVLKDVDGHNLDVTLGAEVWMDRAWGINPGIPTLLISTVDQYENLGVFGEALYSSFIGNLTVGARAEHHSLFGNSFVPRAAYTRRFGDFHLKLLYSQAFRAPGVEDFALAPPDPNTGNPIFPKAEHTQVVEAEVGYQLGSHLFVTANVFNIAIKNPIVYTVVGQSQYYLNFPKTGTEGVEADIRLRYGWGYLDANYSFYTAWSIFADQTKNQVPLYAVGYGGEQAGQVIADAQSGVQANKNLLMGLPAHKLALNARLDASSHLSVNPSLALLSPRYGQTSVDGNGNIIDGYVPTLVLLNVFVTYRDFVLNGLDLGLGGYNLLNSSVLFLQAYSAGHAPIPGASREFAARLSYRLPL